MKHHSIILNICLILSTGCLVLGYIMAGYWQIFPLFLVMPIFWIYTKKQTVFWAASSLLLMYLILAAVGILIDLSVALMIIGCTTALASWDLIQFEQSIIENAMLKKYHLRSLALAVSAGIMLSFVSVYIKLQLPFGVVAFLTLAAILGLTYSVQFMKKKNT